MWLGQEMSVNKVAVALVMLVCIWVGQFHEPRAAESRAPTADRLRTDYEEQIAKLRALMSNPATQEQASQKLGNLAVQAANDLELALALGDADKVAELESLIREKLGDTQPYVEKRAKDGNADALAEAVSWLRDDPERVAAMRNAARPLFETRFDQRIAMKGCEGVLDQCGWVQR